MKVPEVVGDRVQVMTGSWSAESVMEEVVAAGHEEPFYVMDLGEVVARYRRWKDLMPRVEPFYAVKCNDDKVLVRLLAALGAGFDCASKAEIELVTSLGVSPDRIIFANPAKMNSHIKRASSLGVQMMTFDSEVELQKIKQLMPHAQLVIRIRCDAESAQCPLGMKFGCDPVTEAPRLLKLAAIHRLNVMGVSFHVGSGAGEAGVWARGVRHARALFTCAADLGLNMTLLDVGGGFPGGTHTDLTQISQVINSALDTHFSNTGVRVIAEPGRYFAAAAYTLAAMVHSIREIPSTEKDRECHTMYFINDGVYGSFNCVLYDHQQITVKPLKECGGKTRSCSVWGPSCDGLDCVLGSVRLPALALGSWLVFPDMGAYTIPVASPFNGFPVPTVKYVVDSKLWTMLKDSVPLTTTDLGHGFHDDDVTPPDSASPSPPASPASPASPDHLAVFIECALK